MLESKHVTHAKRISPPMEKLFIDLNLFCGPKSRDRAHNNEALGC
jgi:hypothetical protein